MEGKEGEPPSKLPAGLFHITAFLGVGVIPLCYRKLRFVNTLEKLKEQHKVIVNVASVAYC